MKKILYHWSVLLISLVAFSACQDRDLYDPEYVAQLKSKLPDFDAKGIVNIKIDYGIEAANAGISIYAENPVKPVLKDGEHIYDEIVGEPLFSAFLDGNGQFNGEVQLPNAEKKLYIYSSDWTAPTLVETEVVDNSIFYMAHPNAETRASKVKRRVVPDDQLTEIHLSNANGGVTSIVGAWDNYGAATDPNELYGTGVYTTNFVSAIQGTLWDSQGKKKNNSSLVTTTDIVNTSIAKAYQDESGSIITVDEAEIYFTFITESGWNASSVGYYYYPINEVPSSASEVEKFIIVPNSSVSGNNSYQKNGKAAEPEHPGMSTNQKIRLLFRDPQTGQLTSKFPGGYTIGYFIIADGYRETKATSTWSSTTSRVQGSGNYKLTQDKTEKKQRCPDCKGLGSVWFKKCSTCDGIGKVTASTTYSYYYINERNEKTYVTDFYDQSGNKVNDIDHNNYTQYYYDRIIWKNSTDNTNGISYDKPWIYSNSSWNTNGSRFIALTDKNTGEIVYGVEDGGSNSDNSFDDVLFTISCSPNTAIYNPNRPSIKEDGSVEKNIQTIDHGYYLFEDIWSSGGDYDMNDVIVEYKYTENLKNITTYEKETNTGSGSQTTTTTSSNTYIDNVTITITPRHCGATYQDGFALQLPEYFTLLNDNIESIKLNGYDANGSWTFLNKSNTDTFGNVINTDEFMSRYTIEFFNDIKNTSENQGYVLIVKFADKQVTQDTWETIKHKDASINDKRLRWNYNPFLNVYDLSLNGFVTNTGNNILEIHLPLYPYTEQGIPTAGGASSGTGSYDWNLWFVAAKNAGVSGNLESASAFYPFAMDIPYYEGFYPSREMVPIDESYPYFPIWSENVTTDWYKHRAPNRTQPFTLSRDNWIFFDYDVENDYD